MCLTWCCLPTMLLQADGTVQVPHVFDMVLFADDAPQSTHRVARETMFLSSVEAEMCRCWESSGNAAEEGGTTDLGDIPTRKTGLAVFFVTVRVRAAHACLLACLPACLLSACLPAGYLPTACLLACLLACCLRWLVDVLGFFHTPLFSFSHVLISSVPMYNVPNCTGATVRGCQPVCRCQPRK